MSTTHRSRLGDGSSNVDPLRSYTDLLIRIGAPRPNATVPSVEAVIDSDSLFYGGTLQLDQQALRAAEPDGAEYGALLSAALFSHPIQRAYDRAIATAEAKTGGQLRLRLQIDPEVARLQELRWERALHSFGGQSTPISVSSRIPFSRFSGVEHASAHPLNGGPVRIAICVSNPRGLPAGLAPIDVETELRNLLAVLDSLERNPRVSINIAPGHTNVSDEFAAALISAGHILTRGALTLDALTAQFLESDIVHFIGHGASNSLQGAAALYLEDAVGGLELACDSCLLPRLEGAARLPRLVFLMACDSARRRGPEPFAGWAGKLVNAGIPAVMAMQSRISMPDATELARRFYTALFATGVVDFAANEARSYLYESQSSEYSVPALFMGLRDGRLFVPDPALAAAHRVANQPAETEPLLPIDAVRVSCLAAEPELERLSKTGEPALDISTAARDVFTSGGQPRPAFVLLMGSSGSGKSSCLHRIARQTAKASLDSAWPVVPVHVNVSEYLANPSGNFEESLLDRAQRIWPGLTPLEFARRLAGPHRPGFLILVDFTGDLAGPQLAHALRHIVSFAERYPAQQFLIASDFCFASDLEWSTSALVTALLVIKPVSQARARAYLRSLSEPAGRALAAALFENRLYDFARRPWLLAEMLHQTRHGSPPQTRATVLQRVTESCLSAVSTERGMRAHAAAAVYAAALQMHMARAVTVPLSEALPLLEKFRGNRGFTGEDLLQELIREHVFAPVGTDRLRFAHTGLQDYCCAQAIARLTPAEREAIVDDITASLGRLTRLRWWEEALIILSSLLDPAGANHLIESILYGGAFADSDRLFLAVRCIQERRAAGIAPGTLAQASDALIWRSRLSNEPRHAVRASAVEQLAQIEAASAIPHIAALACEPVRRNFLGQADYEYPAVRSAAASALMRLYGPACDYLRTKNPATARTLERWCAGDTEQLGLTLADPETCSASIAAFALADIDSPATAELLVAAFRNGALKRETHWSVTAALEKLDPAIVNQEILDVVHPAHGPDYRYDQCAYLAGRIASRDPEVRGFLYRCLAEWTRVSLKGRAIVALSLVLKPADRAFPALKQMFERIAAGDFFDMPLIRPLCRADDLYLRVSALEALGAMGDAATLDFFRRLRQHWPPEIERQLYLTSEDIYWHTAHIPGRPAS